MRVPAAALALLLFACRFPWQPEDRSCADHARLDLPVDLADYAVGGKLWPFGVHGGAHPEGHPGVDFILDPADARGAIPVKSSFSADIISITPETEIPGSSCIVLDSACVEVNLCHVMLDPALKEGGKVTRGQALGTVALVPSENRYSLHFGTYIGNDADLACPADFLDPDTVECRLGLSAGGKAPERCGFPAGTQTLMGRSEYDERSARTMTVKCSDGSSQSFTLPEENGFCNARFSSADRERMNACLGSACAGVW